VKIYSRIVGHKRKKRFPIIGPTAEEPREGRVNKRKCKEEEINFSKCQVKEEPLSCHGIN
jgi:hypothetical protein